MDLDDAMSSYDLDRDDDLVSRASALGEALRSRGSTACSAESCTGGLIGHAITEIAGSSDYFLGGAVAYANEVKSRLLGVDPELIERLGAVSEEVALAMARGARELFGADLAVATSGIAGPGGGGADKPVGLVYIAVALPGGARCLRRVFSGLSRSGVKRTSAATALKAALEALEAQ